MRKLTTTELNRLDISEYAQHQNPNLVMVLDNIRSMNNIGSAFRTADAFGIGKIYLCGITAQPPHRDIHKTALGATESVSWQYYPQTTEAVIALKQQGFKIIAVEQTDQKTFLQDFRVSSLEKYAFVFGNEVFGVSDEVIELCDIALEIPQFGTKHSFNISVALGIVMWEVIRKWYFSH